MISAVRNRRTSWAVYFARQASSFLNDSYIKPAELVDAAMPVRQSYFKGKLEPPLLESTTSQVLRSAAASHGDSMAVSSVYQNVSMTYTQLLNAAERLARGLLSLDVTHGERIAVSAPNCVEWLVLQHASAMIGAILVKINPAFKNHELANAINTTGSKLLFTGHPTIKNLDIKHPQLDSLEILSHVKQGQLPHLEHVVVIGDDLELPVGALAWDEVDALGSTSTLQHTLETRENSLHSRDPVSMQFTSGTTGLPKAAVLSHHNVVNNGFLVGNQLRLTSNDRICVPVPLFHCFGAVMGNLAAATHRAAVVYPAPFFTPAATLNAVQQHKCTALYSVPTMFIRMLQLENFSSYDLSSLRTGIMAGAPCPEALMRCVRDEMHMQEITVCYGMTETSPVSFQSAVDDPVERRVTTVGKLHPHLEAKVIDPTAESPTADPLPIGASGELCVRGYSTMLGYWQNPEATAKTMDKETGWLRTGDLAVVDWDGYCSIVGRSKDIVIRGGENISPREVEELFHHHPAVAEVHCFGVPDERNGEELCAWICLKNGKTVTEKELREWSLERIARFKVPKYIQFKDPVDIPHTTSGKPQRFKMRRIFCGDMGIEDCSFSPATVR